MMKRTAAAISCATLAVTSIAGAQPGVEPITRDQIVSGAQLARPIFVTHAPGDHSRLFIAEQRTGNQGRIRVYDMHTEQLLPTPLLIITNVATSSEQGLLGLALHPNFAENGHFFVNFTQSNGTTIIRRYTVSENDPNVADPSTAKTILTYTQPFPNHNGGWIGFGPDGYLYIASGDGGSGGDPQNNAQTLTSRLGKMIRVDIDTEDGPYVVPEDNPFLGQQGARPELWAYGLRNPWRASFDRETGDLFIGDVGQNAREEVNFQHADSTGGENYGWKCYEANNSFSTGFCPGNPNLNWPFQDYSLAGSNCAVVGGYVYRGCAIPSLTGTYFFADYCPGTVWSLKYDRDNAPAASPSPPGNHPVSDFFSQTGLSSGITGITSFGEDAAGELYIVTLNSGVYKIVPQTPTISPADLDCSGAVGVPDLLMLLANWGECNGCKADLDGNGTVGVPDLLMLLGEWG